MLTRSCLYLAVLLASAYQVNGYQCGPDEMHNGCKILGHACSCDYGCRNEYVFRTRRDCLKVLRGDAASPYAPPAPTQRTYQHGSGESYHQATDTSYRHGGNPHRGSNPGYRQGSDTDYRQGSEPTYRQGNEPTYRQGSELSYRRQGNEPTYRQGSDPAYRSRSEPSYRGNEQAYRSGSEPSHRQGSDPNNRQPTDASYRQDASISSFQHPTLRTQAGAYDKASTSCHQQPCLRGICIQKTEDSVSCKCEGTGFYGQRCEKACPTVPMRGLKFPYECVVI